MLRVNQFSGFDSRFGRFSFGITDTNTTPTNTVTPTFSSMYAGLPHPKRLVIAAIHGNDANHDEISYTVAATIGGVSADIVGERFVEGSGASTYTGIFQALVPAGVRVDVAATVTGYNPSFTFDTWGCTLVQATNLNSTTALDSDAADASATINTTGARFSVGVYADLNGDLSARTPFSSSGASDLVLGHRITTGLAYIDRAPPGGSVLYSINSYVASDPNNAVAACWG